MKNKLYFITPSYNASTHLPDLYESLCEQTDKNWQWIILNDMSLDNTFDVAKDIEQKDPLKRITVINHSEKKYALKGIYDQLQNLKNSTDPKNTIIAIVDGDDSLCNECTVDIILNNYNKDNDLDALWTAHSWDINSQNISNSMPEKINPYHFPWVSSHLKTFRLSTFLKIKEDNFKDLNGQWFVRGYDQVLYLPILHIAKNRKYVDDICYLYRINSNSILHREDGERKQLNAVKLIRSRGYIK